MARTSSPPDSATLPFSLSLYRTRRTSFRLWLSPREIHPPPQVVRSWPIEIVRLGLPTSFMCVFIFLLLNIDRTCIVHNPTAIVYLQTLFRIEFISIYVNKYPWNAVHFSADHNGGFEYGITGSSIGSRLICYARLPMARLKGCL